MMPCDGSLPTPYPSIAALIQRKASRLARRPEFRRDSPDDVRQDLWCQLLKRLTVDQAAALPAAHLSRVLKQVISKLVRHRRALNRRLPAGACGPFCSSRMPPLSAEDVIEQVVCEASATAATDLAVDVTTVLDTLRADLRELAQELQQETVAEVARRRRIPPSTVYERVRQIRRHFQRAGFSPSRKYQPSSRAQTG